MPNLTSRLAEFIVTDNAILFIGAGLHPESGQPSLIGQIAEVLAAQIDYQRADRGLAAVARDYEVLKGRQALVAALREELRKRGSKPDAVHQLIAAATLPHSKVLTTRFDQTLERALDQFQKPYILIVRDADVPFFDESKITLIKMQGDINQPDSLIITDDDLDAFINRLPAISDVVRAFFATKSLIFLGYDLNSPQFKRFYRQITRNLSAYRRQAYAIVPHKLDDIEARYWETQNVDVRAQNPLAFLENLVQAVKAASQIERPDDPTIALLTQSKLKLPQSPYKALNSFRMSDAPIFAGRKEESQRLANRILAHRLMALYGESGSGKSSLLHAGVAPRLAKQRALLVACQPIPGQPLRDLLRSALLDIGKQAGLQPPDGAGFIATLRDWQRELHGPVVLAIDQFEQFFLVYEEAEQQAAAHLLSELLHDRSLDLRLALILREDFLGRLQPLEKQISGLLDVRFRLERLGREDARAAIEEPARIFGVMWEAALVQTLLDDLYRSADGGISPPQLQIVCARLFEDVVARAGGLGPDKELHITTERFRELGGTPAILGDYVEQAVSALPGEQQPTARTLLGALVSSRGVKQRLPLAELLRFMEADPQMVSVILDQLTANRLLQRYEIPADAGEPQLAYELTHDYLAARIMRWLGRDFWDAQKAREILRAAMPEWAGRGRLLLPDDLLLLTDQQGRMRLTPDELALAYASAVGTGAAAESWANALADEARRDVLGQLLHAPDAAARQHAARHLAPFAGTERAATWLVETILSDAVDAVREAAARALAEPLGSPLDYGAEYLAALKGLLAAAQDDNSAIPDAQACAREALVTMRDLQPALGAFLPPSLRASILRRVRAIRWGRGKGDVFAGTLQGLQGGFWGLGLGMGLFLGLASTSGPVLLRILFGLMFTGVSLAGALGAAAGGAAAFFRAAYRALADDEHPLVRWLGATLIGAGALGTGFVVLAATSPGTVDVFRSFSAGALVGLGLGGAGSAPLPWKWPLRLGLAAATGVAVFMLIAALGLFFNTPNTWLAVMGAASGAGFFAALNPGFWRE